MLNTKSKINIPGTRKIPIWCQASNSLKPDQSDQYSAALSMKICIFYLLQRPRSALALGLLHAGMITITPADRTSILGSG